MSGTLRPTGHVEVGDFVVTPRGRCPVTFVDPPTDSCVLQGPTKNEVVALEDIRMNEGPEELTPESIESWLAEDTFILVRSKNRSCTCLCGQCNYLVIERGVKITVTHQAANDACTCRKDQSCCGYPLGT